MKRRLTEAQIEHVKIEYVFGLTGGELEKEPLVAKEAFGMMGRPLHVGRLPGSQDGYRFTYWYTGVPEYAQSDFELRRGYDDSDFITVIDTACVAPLVLVDPDGTVWARAGSYRSSGETSCPHEDGSTVKVTREHAQLSPKPEKRHERPRWYGDERPNHRWAECPFCEARVGEEHGCIYIGDAAEVVYARVAKPHKVELYAETVEQPPAFLYQHVICTIPGSKDAAGDFSYRARYFKAAVLKLDHPLIVPTLDEASVKRWLWSFTKAHPELKLDPERIEIEETDAERGEWAFNLRVKDEDGEELRIPLFDLSEV